MLVREFDLETLYTLDLKTKTLNPQVKLNSTDEATLSNLFDWFYKELSTRKIDKEEIENCVIEIIVTRSKFLFIPYRIYTFELKYKTSIEAHNIKRTIKGFL